MKKIVDEMALKAAGLGKHDDHEHCYHAFRGPFMMVLKDGHILQKCCKCPETRQVHRGHLFGSGGSGWHCGTASKGSWEPKLSVACDLPMKSRKTKLRYHFDGSELDVYADQR